MRLRSQLLAGNGLATARDVVAHFGAMQAQDYLGALWAVGQRMRRATERDVEDALANREIVRTWPLRGTLHFVAAEDVHWMLDLLAPRLAKRHAPRQEREHGITEAVLRRARARATRALQGGHALTRDEFYKALGVDNGLQLVWRLAHEKLICFGPRRGKQQTFVLLDEWIPPSRNVAPADPLAELARRYFQSHAPATAADFAWWSGLTLTEARRLTLSPPETRDPRGTVRLLPPFDEYTVAYKNRDAILDPQFARRVNAGGGMLNAVVVANGRVVGTWKRAGVEVSLFGALTQSEEQRLAQELQRYKNFVNVGTGFSPSRY